MAKFPRVSTPVTQAQSIALFLERFSQAFGRVPDYDTAAGLLTLLWHENAKGAGVIQFNWGNLAAPASILESVDYWEPPWLDDEYIASLPHGAKRSNLESLAKQAKEGKAPVAFRKWHSHSQGIDQWLQLLVRPHMRHIIAAAGTGNPEKLWRAVAWPNPDDPDSTLSYCPHCRSKAVLKQYQSLHSELRKSGYLAHLKKKRADSVELSRWALERFSWSTSRRVDLPVLELGCEGDAVALWQVFANRLLAAAGSPVLCVDGRFGERTHQATQVVQDASAQIAGDGVLVSVEVDGVVGRQTWALAIEGTA